MKHVLERKLKQTRKRITKYRREGYNESVRAEKRNVKAIKRQLALLDGVK